MYFKYDNFDEVKTELVKMLADYQARVRAWEAVTIEKKKNGEEMAQLGRALKNARIGGYYPVEDAAHPYISIYYESYGYKSDHLEAFFYDGKTPKDGNKRDPLPVERWQEKTYKMTADDIREAISKEIDSYNSYISSLKKQIEQGREIFDEYRAAIEEAEKRLTERDKQLREAGEIYPTSLYHRIKEARS